MASGRDRGRRWTNVTPWQIFHSRLTDNTPRGSQMEIWNFFRTSPFSEPGLPHMRFVLDDEDDFWDQGGLVETRIRDWLTTRSLELDERYVKPIDTKAVLSKCRKEVYKRGGSKGKAVAEQEECPVCLEKFVADEDLYSLPCSHRFHIDCLTPWINSNHGCCPCCRADILGGGKGTGNAIPSNNSSSSSSSNARANSNLNNARASSNLHNTRASIIPTAAPVRNGPIIPNAAPVRNVPISSGRAVSNSNNTSTARTTQGSRREPDDIMIVLAAMEAALDRFGFGT